MPPSPVPAPLSPVDAWAVAMAYLPLVRRVAREYRHGPWDTDDLIQEGLIGARNAALRYDTEQHSFFYMVEKVARNRMRDWLRWRHRDRRATGNPAGFFTKADRIDAIELAEVLAAIDLLPDRRRTILREHFGLDGPARLEAVIGAELGVSRDVVAQNKFRALGKVREQLGVAS